jgi:tRNA A37 threonylcarbamoyltransferase TsaD
MSRLLVLHQRCLVARVGSAALQSTRSVYSHACWTVLGIETSCDDTAVAVVQAPKPQCNSTANSNDTRSIELGGDARIMVMESQAQHEQNRKFKGINPPYAARAHYAALPSVVASVLTKYHASYTGSASTNYDTAHQEAAAASPAISGTCVNEHEAVKSERPFDAEFIKSLPLAGIDAIAVTSGPGTA